jgi:hypothetical protein
VPRLQPLVSAQCLDERAQLLHFLAALLQALQVPLELRPCLVDDHPLGG